MYGYFGELNPLSNFHRAPFTHENFTYHCSEQFIQKKKAELFKDASSIKKIEEAKTGLECKLLGNKIANSKKSTWEKRAKELCTPGIRQKFVENRDALITLIKATGNRSIAECAKDTVWGCGIVLQDDRCLIKTEWTNQGIMGEILEEIRKDLTYLVQDSTSLDDTESSDTSAKESSSDESGTDDADMQNETEENAEAMITEPSSSR